MQPLTCYEVLNGFNGMKTLVVFSLFKVMNDSEKTRVIMGMNFECYDWRLFSRFLEMRSRIRGPLSLLPTSMKLEKLNTLASICSKSDEMKLNAIKKENILGEVIGCMPLNDGELIGQKKDVMNMSLNILSNISQRVMVTKTKVDDRTLCQIEMDRVDGYNWMVYFLKHYTSLELKQRIATVYGFFSSRRVVSRRSLFCVLPYVYSQLDPNSEFFIDKRQKQDSDWVHSISGPVFSFGYPVDNIGTLVEFGIVGRLTPFLKICHDLLIANSRLSEFDSSLLLVHLKGLNAICWLRGSLLQHPHHPYKKLFEKEGTYELILEIFNKLNSFGGGYSERNHSSLLIFSASCIIWLLNGTRPSPASKYGGLLKYTRTMVDQGVFMKEAWDGLEDADAVLAECMSMS